MGATDPSQAANDAFVRHKSRHAITWALVNLQRIHERPCATTMGEPLKGRTAFVVGADYTLTRNGEWLREAQRKGGAIIGVNSSDPVMRRLGVRPDAIVVRESIDNSAEVRESDAAMVCVDVCAHPEIWTAAGERCAWFVPGYPRHFHITQRLGIRPTFGGSSAFTTAVHFALTWGAERIVLVGAGLALQQASDGTWRAYHPAAPRGDCVGMIHGDALHLIGNERNDAVCVRSGQQPQPKVIGFSRVPSQDWGEQLPIIDTLFDQRQWLEIEAGRHGQRVELIQASEGGAGVVGWRTRQLEDVVREMPERTDEIVFRANYPASVEDVRALATELRTECDLLERMSLEMLADGGPSFIGITRMERLHFGAPLIDKLAAHRLLDAPRGDPRSRCEFTYRTMAEIAGEARRILARADA